MCEIFRVAYCYLAVQPQLMEAIVLYEGVYSVSVICSSFGGCVCLFVCLFLVF